MIFDKFSNILLGFSLLALLVMNVGRYLATYHPIFHRTSLTKGKLLTLFTFSVIIEKSVAAMSINNLVISKEVSLLIFNIALFFPCCLSTTNCLQSSGKVVETKKYQPILKNRSL